jgi:2-polyprenyl-3-methyl-5-hydroxy-6-metoxy-1,4-benzoquinol methylase
MGFQPGARLYRREILDLGTASDHEVRRSLSDLRRINSWLGGRRVLGKLLAEQLQRTGLPTFTMLDVGTGSGDLPEYVARRFRARIVGMDRQLRHLREGRGGWTPLCADMRQLPFAPRSFDFVTASLVLHHFEDSEAAELLARLAGLARHALLVNDLERHEWAWRFIRHAPLFCEVSRVDGEVSVQQAFTSDELASLARRANLERFRVRRHIPFRLSLAVELS